MISTIQFAHGEKTCAVDKGVFCRWQGTMGFGQRAVCMLFGDEPLREDKPYGWLMRCQQCIDAFGGGE